MNPKTKTATAALGSAVVLASGAYALGTQRDDGSATAAPSPSTEPAADRMEPPPRMGARPGLATLADRLKVSESDLRKALGELRPRRRLQVGPDEKALSELAKELGVSEAKVREAFGKLHGQRRAGHDELRDQIAASVAKSLGVSEAKARGALDDLRPRGPGRDRRDVLKAAADELGVSTAQLRKALRDARPDRPHRIHRRADMAADLAKALGVDQDKVETALQKLGQQRRADRDEKRADFAKELARKLGIPESRVEEALPKMPRGPGRIRHHGGPGGPPPMGPPPPAGP